ncbi:phosphatidylserine/phosphatidylglycerophosphate/cardiolipin synthase family protein [Kytococcus schroeteri]|uniref:phospholipase D-like domain-containing protein n=1 Tax=Kytococcus schroeteri TaxID=138300 RepID=UPI00192D089E|nr:phosphatidylserine/phosphatidylglycerophosphate/cardiolipin synthase family protein [Kytococcus schroeteri]
MPHRTVAKVVAYGLGAQAVAQAAVVAGLVVSNRRRKRRSPEVISFPTVEPVESSLDRTTITTYTFGRDVFADMLEAIRGARREIFFESYILKGDAVGRAFKEALCEAAERGVAVHVVFDGFANLVVPREFKRWPPGVHTLEYPVVTPDVLLGPRHWGRDHRKILVVDEEVGFVGGYNVGQEYATQWRDTHVRVTGAAVAELVNVFIDFWNRHRHEDQPELSDGRSRAWGLPVQAHRNAPSRLLFPIRGMYLEAIDRADETIWITQAYFIPDREILEELLRARRRGVDVKVILPERSNHVVADWVARYYFEQLLSGGVELWLYQDAMVHAKTAVVDGVWVTVGTANIDRLSLTGNYEVNLEILDAGQAAHMQEIFRRDLTNCRQLTLAEWRGRAWWARGIERLLQPLQPLL